MVPFDCSCAKCGKYVVHAGSYPMSYNDNDPELRKIIDKFCDNFLCDECNQYRKRIGMTREEYLAQKVGT